ncbi:TolC family protein [Novosphingobium sp. FKTRR1]|uniref:TolC family protein n=1 Tax=Novosphingobium sp. FKTRR1 TaxID=2879118 RepID=UPI001CF00E93|nr:TolC family protein [Novosphingobium sp. FKTRR1]
MTNSSQPAGRTVFARSLIISVGLSLLAVPCAPLMADAPGGKTPALPETTMPRPQPVRESSVSGYVTTARSMAEAQAPTPLGPPAPADEGTGERDYLGGDADERVQIRPALPSDTPADIVARADAAVPVTELADALRLAYWTSPSVLAQRATLQQYGYRQAEVRAEYGPKLDYQLTHGWQRDDSEPTFLQRRLGSSRNTIIGGWSSSAAAILTQPLYTFGRNFSQERAASAQRAYQIQLVRSNEQQALLDAVSAYVGVLRDRAGVGIATDNLQALQRELGDNQARLKVREVTATDLEQVLTRYELGRAQLYSAQRDAASSEANFVQRVGAPAGALVTPPEFSLPVQSLEEAYAFAEVHSPILLAAHEREKVSRAGVSAAKADLMPRLDLRASATRGSLSAYDNYAHYNEEKAEIILSGPIFESGLRQAKVAEAQAANDSDWRLIDAALRESRSGLAQAWNDWLAQSAGIDRLAASVASAQRAYDGAVLQERAGQFTTLDVLQLLRELLSVRSSYTSAVANAYIAKARLLALMGALEPGWVLPGEARYDAEGRSARAAGKGNTPVVTTVIRAIDGLDRAVPANRVARDPGSRFEPDAVRLSEPAPPK